MRRARAEESSTLEGKVDSFNNSANSHPLLEPIPRLQTSVANPLKVFPSKTDSSVCRTFFSNDGKRHANNFDKRTRWLNPLKVEPNFGVLGGASEEVAVRRAFRRVESSNLFVHPKIDDVSLADLETKKRFLFSRTAPALLNDKGPQGSSIVSDSQFILVEASRLEELTRFENILRDERERLGQQCAWIFNDFSAHARFPLPATRLAIQNLCEVEMRKAAAEMRILDIKWNQFSKQNHYDKPHMYLNKDPSYFQGGPLAQRTIKLKLVREATENWRIRKERDTMLYEDDLSFLTEKYLKGQIRRRDYDKYYILATRYGVYSEEEFSRDSRPGRRYWMRANKAARMFQLAWDRYWAVAKLRRFRAARRIQTVWRRFWIMKTVTPIVRLHKKYSKRAYYRFAWVRWKIYVSFIKNIKESLRWWLTNWVPDCFRAWKGILTAKKARQEYVKSRFVILLSQAGVFSRFSRWVQFTRKRQRGRRYFKRMIKYPHFGSWLDYVKMNKLRRKLGKAATKIQAAARMMLTRKLYLKKMKAQHKILRFFVLSLARLEALRRRRRVVNKEFENWLPGQTAKRLAKENEQERLRLGREQQAMMDREKKARSELKKFLRTVHGRVQLREMATERLLKVGRKIPFWGPRPEDMQAVKKSLLAQYCTFARHLERHDFCTVNPPFVQCPDPRCRAVFVTEEQYTSHMRTSAPHNGKAPQYAQFHLMIRNPLGVQLLRNHMMAKHGIGSIVNCIDAWLAIQEWKKVHSREENYHSKGVSIFELYIDDSAPRSVHLESPSIEALRSNLAIVKAREYKGYYQGAFAGPTFLRRVLGIHGQFYEKWTDEQIVPATIFDDVEWECFLNLFQMCDRAYPGSSEHLVYIKAIEAVEEKERLEKLHEYEGIRLRRFYEQAREVKKLDEEITKFALRVMDVYLDREVDFQCTRITPVAVEEAIVKVLCNEQAAHEPLAMVADEAFFWAENNILDEFFDFYVPAFIKSMWEQPELRHGMMQYAGVVRKNIRKKSQTVNIKLDVKNESHEWFQKFMRNAKDEEKVTLPLNSQTASVRIQRRVRGVLGRNKARKQFTAFYAKRYDPTTKLYYYANLKTGASMWERPKMFRHLYPKFKW